MADEEADTGESVTGGELTHRIDSLVLGHGFLEGFVTAVEQHDGWV